MERSSSMEPQNRTGKSRADLLEEYKNKKILGVSANGNSNMGQGAGAGKSTILKPMPQKKMKAKDGNAQLEVKINKLIQGERKSKNFQGC
jgi:hypothetical protein